MESFGVARRVMRLSNVKYKLVDIDSARCTSGQWARVVLPSLVSQCEFHLISVQRLAKVDPVLGNQFPGASF
jgi:hypothetical protein